MSFRHRLYMGLIYSPRSARAAAVFSSRRRINILASSIASFILLLLIFGAGVVSADFERGVLTGVVKVDIDLDLFSSGPELERDISRQPVLNPYMTELRRRLQTGASGSGFCIYPELLVTNAHIVLAGARYPGLKLSTTEWESLEAVVLASTKPSISVMIPGRQKVTLQAQVTAIDIMNDLAVLRFSDPSGIITPLELANPNQLQPGLPIVAVGYSANGLRVARGKVLSLIRGKNVVETARVKQRSDTADKPLIVGARDGDVVRFQHSASAQEGVSGGPVLNKEGQVVGVSYALLRAKGADGQTRHMLPLAISTEVVSDFINGLAVKIPLPTDLSEENPATVMKPGPAIMGTPNFAWKNSSEELADIRRRIEMGSALGTLSPLEARLRRNRYDYVARALLVAAHRHEARFDNRSSMHALAAFYQAAWLAFLAPEVPFARDSLVYIEDTSAKAKSAKFAVTPGPVALFSSLEMDYTLREAMLSGQLSESLSTDKAKLETMLAKCEKGRSGAARSDVVALASLVRANITMEEALEVWSGLSSGDSDTIREERVALLRKAQNQARSLALKLYKSPGAYSLLGTASVRLSRLENEAENLRIARDAFDSSATLDPDSISIRAAREKLEIN